MTLRTPRRRISPRTKRKYRAIKNFLRRALGTSSQGDILTNTTLEVSVSDLKTKIECIQHQLNRVSNHCQDIASQGEGSRKESENLATRENFDTDTSQKSKKSKRNFKKEETKVLYQKPFEDCNERENIITRSRDDKKEKLEMTLCEPTFSKNVIDEQYKTKINRRCKNPDASYDCTNKIRTKTNIIPSTYSSSSFHSLGDLKPKDYVNPAFTNHRQKHQRRKEHITVPEEYADREVITREVEHGGRHCDRHHKHRKKRDRRVDEDFIADIIEKQYKPVKLFGKRHSDFSQFSAPVCRDQEFKIHDEILEGSELCSCCFDNNRQQNHRYIRSNDLSDMRSICDTRLYSSKKYRSYKNTTKYIDDYNNSTMYDVVPVKEKSSPKSRRKFADDNKMMYQFKEVPPSPRTQRPRLNLKIHNYTEYENSIPDVRHHHRNKYANENRKQTDIYESDDSIKYKQMRNRKNESLRDFKIERSGQYRENLDAVDCSQTPHYPNDPINTSNNDTTLNTQVTDISANRTDKTLGEIKNILQSFLMEIKKESVHDEKTNNKSMSDNHESNKTNVNTVPNSRYNINHNTGGQCTMPPFLPTFPSPCCYPIIPICPMNCLQSGYGLPNPSFTCMACTKTSKDNTCAEKETYNNIQKESETQELIKEIYKFVSGNPKTPHKFDECITKRNFNKTLLTNRSVGSTKAYKNDANVGTPNMKCFSKSCEAIGSRKSSEACYTTNTSYSDTVLEKLSLEETQSSTESDVSTNLPKKHNRSTFKQLLRSLRLLKKKKDVIEELSESDSAIEVRAKPKPPFKQHITNYAMHGQEYFHPPPIPVGHHCCAPHPQEYYDCRNGRNSSQLPIYNQLSNAHKQYYDPVLTQRNPNFIPAPSSPNYDSHYNQLQPPQVPLCLKEIEVKSIGTQSVRKMSIFRKFTKKIQPSVQQDITQQYNSQPAQNKPTLWKSLQEKAKQPSTDPMAYSMKTQKQLAEGDMKLRSAMLKKLFYKRNPFSPRNLIIKTLLGKDKSSFGNPPKMYRPRMFL